MNFLLCVVWVGALAGITFCAVATVAGAESPNQLNLILCPREPHSKSRDSNDSAIRSAKDYIHSSPPPHLGITILSSFNFHLLSITLYRILPRGLFYQHCIIWKRELSQNFLYLYPAIQRTKSSKSRDS